MVLENLLNAAPFFKFSPQMAYLILWVVKANSVTVLVLLRQAIIPEFSKWTLPSSNLDMSTDANRGCRLK